VFNYQNAMIDPESYGAESYGRYPMRSGNAFNALRTELAAAPTFAPAPAPMPAFSPPPTPELPAFSPLPAPEQRAQVMPNPTPVETPFAGAAHIAPVPPVPSPDTIRTTLSAPAQTMAAPSAPATPAAPAGAGSFRSFLTDNPHLSNGSAASLLSAFQNWSGQPHWQGFTPGGTGFVGSPNSNNPFSAGSGTAPQQNAIQNFYETRGYYPGQGG
jgi:hypothetical protein